MTFIVDGTNGATFPIWTTATRPATPATGQVGWNSTIGSLENYNGSAWTAVGGGGAGSWQSIQTANFTAASGNAYLVNTTSSAITVNLPASPSFGQFATITDYASTFGLNACTVSGNGSLISGSSSNQVLSLSGESISFVYSGSVKGWVAYASQILSPTAAYSASYLIAAGGGSGGSGGGGAGGVLTGTLNAVPSTAYTVTVGGGAAGASSTGNGNTGSNSVVSGIGTALGGGYASGDGGNGGSGGSGGGGGATGGGTATGGSGTAGQGYAGGAQGGNTAASGGGGGAGAAGNNGSGSNSGNGGIGILLSATATYYGGGGGGGNRGAGSAGVGGTGGGGTGSNSGGGGAGSANTGGGGGGAVGYPTFGTGGNGGSGVVIIYYLGSQKGTGGTVTSAGGYTIHTFTTSGTFTA